MHQTSKSWLRRTVMILTVVGLGVAGCGQGDRSVDARSENTPTAAAAIEARYEGLSPDAVEEWTDLEVRYDGLSPDATEHWTQRGTTPR